MYIGIHLYPICRRRTHKPVRSMNESKLHWNDKFQFLPFHPPALHLARGWEAELTSG